MDMSLMQKVLGDDWYKLPTVIQQHYQLNHQHSQNKVTGKLTIDFPWFVKPILVLVRLMGGLLHSRGQHLNTCVEKWINQETPLTLFWRRRVQLPNRKEIVFASKMHYEGKNQIIESIGGGFGLCLHVAVEEQRLVYRSCGHLWQLGFLTLPIPDVLFLGHATITETALSDHTFKLDFQIHHPLFGNTYNYTGEFLLDNPQITAQLID